MHEEPLRRESLLVASGRPPRTAAGPVNQPISLTSTFHAGGERVYGREGNDSVEAFEAALGAVEGGRVTAFSSGMAACAALIEGLPVGSVVVLPTTFYNFNRTLLDKQVELGRLSLRTVDVTDTAAALDALPQATMLWLELPTNPMLAVPDLPVLAAA
ncbi:MAG TPA: PLP-dependent transferase, partial [Jatrophihabitans sp.]